MNYKKIVIIIGAFIGLVLVYFGIMFFLINTVDINSETETKVTVYKLPENSLVLETDENTFHSIKLGRGNYTLDIAHDESSTKKTISIGFRENIKLDITPEPLLSSVKTSPQKVKDVGLYKNTVVGLQEDSTLIINELGEIVYKQFSSPIDKIIFANDSEFGEIGKNGDFLYSKNLIPRTLHSASSIENLYNPVIDADFNNESSKFCILLENGRIFSVNYDGIVTADMMVDESNNFIRCAGDTTVVGVYAKFSDGDEKKGTTPGNITIYKSTEKQSFIDDVELNAIDIINANNIIYTDNKAVYSYVVDDEKRTVQQNIISLGEDALFVNKKTELVYVFDEEDVWELDVNNSVSKKISSGYNFRAVNSVGLNSAGELIYSIDSRSFDHGIYRLTKNSELGNIEKTVRKSLPKKDYFYSADYVIVDDKINIFVSIFGDIPSTESSKNFAKRKAESFINSLGLSKSVNVIYKN